MSIDPCHPEISAVESPSVAVIAAEKFVSLRSVGDFPGSPVIFDFFPDAVGDPSEKKLLDHVSTVFEIAGGFQGRILARINHCFWK